MEESYDRKNQYCGNWEMRIIDATYEFEYSPLEAAICHGKYFRRDLKFLEILNKNNFLVGIDLLKNLCSGQCLKWKPFKLWNLFYQSLCTRQPLYSHYDLQYESLVHDPIQYAIRMQDLPKLKVCEFLHLSFISKILMPVPCIWP